MANLSSTAQPAAIPFDPLSPAVRLLPALYAVHRRAEFQHQDLVALGDDLPRVLSGWVQQEAAAHLEEAFSALCRCADIIAKGVREVRP